MTFDCCLCAPYWRHTAKSICYLALKANSKMDNQGVAQQRTIKGTGNEIPDTIVLMAETEKETKIAKKPDKYFDDQFG